MSASSIGVRPRGFAVLEPAGDLRAPSRTLMRGQNFWVEWVRSAAGGAPATIESDAEALLITVDTCLTVERPLSGVTLHVPARSVCILPSGGHVVRAPDGGRHAMIASHRGDLGARQALNQASYEPPDERIAPTGRPYRRVRPLLEPQVLGFDGIQAPAERSRLKMVQTETLSINLVAYEGPRDRRALSPHSHADFEQGSLAMAGRFVHHLRVPWGPDAGQWRDDEHVTAPSPSLVVVPVEMVHTTEGVGEGLHVLVDIFSPPRRDFIAKGWVFNAKDYEACA